MIQSLLIGVGGIVGLMIVWILVQSLWRDNFSEYLSEPDVLAGRNSCGNCGCSSICTKKENALNS